MKNSITTNFILCGLCGWCMECFWTGLSAIKEHKDRQLHCKTSVWMFPIYGMGAFLLPISKRIKSFNLFFRGTIYTICIFFAEFFTGKALKKYNACPWDYSKAKFNYQGLIRFDYAPLWFAVGLFYEKVLSR